MQQEISLREIFFAIRKKWKWIVLGGVLGAFLAFALSAYVLPKRYTASLDMYVNNNREDTETGNRNQNDLNASQMLVDTYTVILENDAVLSQVAADLGHITLDELKQALRFGPVGATEVLRISAETEDPQFPVPPGIHFLLRHCRQCDNRVFHPVEGCGFASQLQRQLFFHKEEQILFRMHPALPLSFYCGSRSSSSRV